MTRHRPTVRLWTRLAAVGSAAVVLSSCSGAERAAGTPEPVPTSTSTRPTATNVDVSTPPAPGATTSLPAAGESEAAAVAVLPIGDAGGTVLLTFDGLGEVDSPITGECTRDDGATIIEAEAGSATVRLAFTTDVVTLTVQDDGLGEFASQLGRADVAIDGNRLRLEAALVQGGQVTGSITLDVTCVG